MKQSLQRLGGMVWSHRATLGQVLAGAGDLLEPLVWAILCVTVCYPLTVGRYVLLAQVDPLMALGRLLAANGLVWTKLMNEVGFCGVAAAGFLALNFVCCKKVRFWESVNAGLYLFVPMGVLMLLGVALARLGWNIPWLPHQGLDSPFVYEGNTVHLERFYGKLVVEMVWPALLGLAAAWRMWRGR